jgi:hypothetical protein
VAELDAKNERWVRGAAGLSSRVIVDILRWSGAQVDDHYANLDLAEDSSVIWASNSSTPRWFDLCRDFTERWVHQQHIRDAVRQPGSHDRFLPLVLRTFVWAFPHQYRAQAPEGTAVGVDLDVGGEWVLVRRPDHWSLEAGPTDSPEAAIRILAPVAWRQLTGQPVEPENITIEGPAHLIRELLEVRGIIV